MSGGTQLTGVHGDETKEREDVFTVKAGNIAGNETKSVVLAVVGGKYLKIRYYEGATWTCDLVQTAIIRGNAWECRWLVPDSTPYIVPPYGLDKEGNPVGTVS